MADELKLGLVGLDTSHVVAFTKILNDEKHPRYIPGGRVVAAYPSFSQDVHSSVSRVEGFTAELKDNFGVRMVDSVEALCEIVDGVLIESVDGRRHLEEYRPVAAAGKPCFIDKPMTANAKDAAEIARVAKEGGARVFSSSSLRMVPEIQEVTNNPEKIGEVQQAHIFSPAHLEPTNPGLFWYGVHGVEMLYTLMGPGCESVVAFSEDSGDIVLGNWKDGRRATLAANRLSRNDYGGVVHGEKATRAFVCDLKDIYVPLVQSVIRFFNGEKAPVPIETTVEMMAFMETASESNGNLLEIPKNLL